MKKKIKLTPIQEKRVIILKDALAQIRAQIYDVRSACGFVGQSSSNFDLELDDLICELNEKGVNTSKTEFQKYFAKLINKKEPCQVCAKGALFLSTVKKFNNLALDEAINDGLNDLAGEGYKIASVFGRKNIDRMEEYFECNDSKFNENGEEWQNYFWEIDGKNPNDYKKWSDQYDNDTDRLVAIIKNAISNNGIFKP